MSLIRNHTLLTGNWHPAYKAVLNRATGSGYGLPSYPCMRLQNQMIKELHDNALWNFLDFFICMAATGIATGNANFLMLNMRQPALTTVTPVSANITVVNKKGVYGYGNSNYYYGQKISTSNANDCFQAVMMGTAGGAVAALEQVFGMNDGNGYWTSRYRTNPRLDFLMNHTTASPQVYVSAIPVSQRLYAADFTSGAGGNGRVYWSGAINTTGVGASGNFEPVAAQANLAIGSVGSPITSTRAAAFVMGGASLYAASGYTDTKHVALNTILQKYMNNLNNL